DVFDLSTFWNIVVGGFALIGFISSVVKRNLTGAWLGIMCFALMAAVYLTRDSLPVIGLLWNPRLLPFLYLMRLLLMMVGIVELVHYVVRNYQHVRELGDRSAWITGLSTAGGVTLVVLVIILFIFRVVPGASYATKNGKSVYTLGIAGWDPITLTPSSKDAEADGWTRYNFEGYEGRPAYGEYRALIDQMAAIGKDPKYGCGRTEWENNGDTGAYGTTMALMLLPHWTDGCITSMEGVFFEASGTTPYHFLTASAISSRSSDPVRELRYDDNKTSIGVPYMQSLGVRYMMVFTDSAKTQADEQPELTKIATSGPWNIYQVAGSDLVEPLTTQPVVVNHRSGDQRERNLELGTSWFQHRGEWAAMPADGGPSDWQRIDVALDPTRDDGKAPGTPGRKVNIVVPAEPIQPKVLAKVTVSNTHLGEQDISFDVDQVGVPVLVKVSYFPNWQVDGAQGPWRIGPNMMVVVPTSTHVRLHYERSTLDYTAYALTLLGIGLLIYFRIRGDVKHHGEHPFGPLFDGPPVVPASGPDGVLALQLPLAGAAFDDGLKYSDNAFDSHDEFDGDAAWRSDLPADGRDPDDTVPVLRTDDPDDTVPVLRTDDPDDPDLIGRHVPPSTIADDPPDSV
ncbi:MAG: hypothetical protein ABIQ39_05010, partial [Ilumatobacteraceae bacterium]